MTPPRRFLALAALLALSLAAPAWAGPLTLEIFHVNDSHGHLDPEKIKTELPGLGQVELASGGAARMATRLARLRAPGRPSLFLHAGDVFRGTLYYNVQKGRLDAELLGLMGLDAMCLGNHEFDRGDDGLLEGLKDAAFPILAANIDLGANPALAALVKPFVVKEVAGEKVGIIGLITPQVPEISNPGKGLVFRDPAEAAAGAGAALRAQGVDKIIALSHLGYAEDQKLARRVAGLDVIVGGHSHTLLGEFGHLGLEPEGPYPTVVDNGGEKTLVVQAWSWLQVLGRLRVSFDEAGRVKSWRAAPEIIVGSPVRDASGATLAGERLAAAREAVSRTPRLVWAARDKAVEDKLAGPRRQIQVYRQTKVGQAAEALTNDRLPNPAAPHGSPMAQMVAQAMLERTRRSGIAADAAIVNAGGVRAGLAAGPVSAADIYTAQPFGNYMLVVPVSGAELRQIIQDGLDAASGSMTGGFPYTAGLRYRFRAVGGGFRLAEVEMLTPDGAKPLDDQAGYQLVINTFIGSGRDGYKTLGRLANQANPERQVRVTSLEDAETLMDYIKEHSPLKRPADPSVTLVP